MTANDAPMFLTLWATPRSTSTAFEWMMRQRGDFECHHEPWNELYYYGEDRVSARDAHVDARSGHNYPATWELLSGVAHSGRVFVKDFVYSVEHTLTDDMLAAMTRANTFGRFGSLSPSVWVDERHLLQVVAERPKPDVRLWVDMGGESTMQEIWSIRMRLQTIGNRRDLALFNLAIDSKLRGCDLVRLRVSDVASGGEMNITGGGFTFTSPNATCP